MKVALLTVAVILSLLSMVLAAAPFTPAILFSFVMLLVGGCLGFLGYLQSSVILLLINSLAVVVSPSTDIGQVDTLLFVVVLFVASYSGLLFGVRKLIKSR